MTQPTSEQETWPQRLRRIGGFYLRWGLVPWAVVVSLLLMADAIWRML